MSKAKERHYKRLKRKSIALQKALHEDKSFRVNTSGAHKEMISGQKQRLNQTKFTKTIPSYIPLKEKAVMEWKKPQIRYIKPVIKE